jgi:hypothetical protein
MPRGLPAAYEMLMRGSGVLGKRIHIACLLPRGALTRFSQLSGVGAFCIFVIRPELYKHVWRIDRAPNEYCPLHAQCSHCLSTRRISDGPNVNDSTGESLCQQRLQLRWFPNGLSLLCKSPQALQSVLTRLQRVVIPFNGQLSSSLDASLLPRLLQCCPRDYRCIWRYVRDFICQLQSFIDDSLL